MLNDDDGITKDERVPSLVSQHRLTVLIGVTIIIAIAFTAVGLVLYNTSGTAQLDLSRPGFKGVDEVVKQNQTTLTEYPASGPINEDTLSEFNRLFQKHHDDVTSIDAFSGDPLAPEELGINEAPLPESSEW